MTENVRASSPKRFVTKVKWVWSTCAGVSSPRNITKLFPSTPKSKSAATAWVELLIPEFLFHKHRREFPLGLDGIKGLSETFATSLTAMAIRYAELCTEAVAVVVSEEERILYSVLSKPFAAALGVSAGWGSGSGRVPEKSVTRKLNAGGKVISEERELVEEVIGLGRYGKTVTVLSVGCPSSILVSL